MAQRDSSAGVNKVVFLVSGRRLYGVVTGLQGWETAEWKQSGKEGSWRPFKRDIKQGTSHGDTVKLSRAV